MRGPRRAVVLLGAGVLSAGGLWLTRGPMSAAHHRWRPGPAAHADVRAPVGATTAGAAELASGQTATSGPRPSRPAPAPGPARRAAVRFLRSFAALLYGRGDPEALPDASPAVRQQANGAPELADPGSPRGHRVRGPWPDLAGPPAPGDVRLHAQVVDADQILEVDLELKPDSRSRRWTVVGLGW